MLNMKKLFSILLLCLGTQVYAVEFEGVKLDEQLQLDSHQLILNGTGLRKKFFFKVYVAALYLTGKKNTSELILADGGAKRMAFHLLREVSGKQMLEAINEVLPANHTAEEMKALEARLAELSRIFGSVAAVKKGEVILFDYLPGSGTRITIAGQQKGRIEGADFNRALLKVWIGDKPVQADMKQTLLGNEQ
ncbi:MAG: hypothetical protein B7Y56_04125 [Gallionellales bacterium 35-53-114]|jgi:hypothetical protein|nr:MAG: hypothetical protein B7Y56_04125 [Gallionellales bacterium 35-53-114]OZB08191.1 MAG: hypothetical protein B7X61_11735 [Gallionellales bacterium 39-52-133]